MGSRTGRAGRDRPPLSEALRRRGDIAGHESAMIGRSDGLAIAGAFTLVPGRLMHQATLGQGQNAG